MTDTEQPYTPSLSAWPTPDEVRATFTRARDRLAFDRMIEAVRAEERETFQAERDEDALRIATEYYNAGLGSASTSEEVTIEALTEWLDAWYDRAAGPDVPWTLALLADALSDAFRISKRAS